MLISHPEVFDVHAARTAHSHISKIIACCAADPLTQEFDTQGIFRLSEISLSLDIPDLDVQ